MTLPDSALVRYVPVRNSGDKTMAEDWYADVNKHAPGADETVVRKIVNHCGIALRNRDSQLVSFGDATEIGRVRERFLRKKLALTDGDEILDRGIAAVRDHMAADRTKNRVTVYYLLADWFGKHDLFGGSASAPGSFSFAAPAAAGAVAAPAKPKAVRKAPVAKAASMPAATASPAPRKAAAAPVAKVASAPVASAARAPRKTAVAPAAAVAATMTAAEAPPAAPAPAPAHQSLYTAPEGDAGRPMYIGYKDEGGGMVWPHWSAIAALVVAVIAAVVLTR